MAIKTISWQPCPSATKWRQSPTYTLFPNDPLGWIKLIPSLKSQISPLMSQIPQTRAIKQNVLWWLLGQLRNVQFRWHKGLEVTEHLVLSDCVMQSWVHPDLLQRPHSLALILSLHVPYVLIATHAFFSLKKWVYQKYYKNLYVNTHTHLSQTFYIVCLLIHPRFHIMRHREKEVTCSTGPDWSACSLRY